MFRANPKPTSGIWWIGSTEIPTGETVNNKGQLISEEFFPVFRYSKNQRLFFTNICPSL